MGSEEKASRKTSLISFVLNTTAQYEACISNAGNASLIFLPKRFIVKMFVQQRIPPVFSRFIQAIVVFLSQLVAWLLQIPHNSQQAKVTFIVCCMGKNKTKDANC